MPYQKKQSSVFLLKKQILLVFGSSKCCQAKFFYHLLTREVVFPHACKIIFLENVRFSVSCCAEMCHGYRFPQTSLHYVCMRALVYLYTIAKEAITHELVWTTHFDTSLWWWQWFKCCDGVIHLKPDCLIRIKNDKARIQDNWMCLCCHWTLINCGFNVLFQSVACSFICNFCQDSPAAEIWISVENSGK